MPVIFFDIGDTLATPTFSADGELLGFTVFPEVLQALEALRERALRMGIISNRGDIQAKTVTRALEECGLLGFFDPALVIYEKKDSPAVFAGAAKSAGVPPGQCIFVGENSAERNLALHAGFSKAIPHPSLVPDIIDGDALIYALIAQPADGLTNAGSKLFDDLAIVPLRATGGNERQAVYAISSKSAATRLRQSGFDVTTLGKDDDPQTTDLYLIRDDRSMPEGLVSSEEYSAGFLAERNMRDLVVGSAEEGLLVALPPDVSVEDIHFPEALHGHNERLIPDMSLMTFFRRVAPVGSVLAAPSDAAFQPTLSVEELEALRGITDEGLQQLHQPYTGAAPLDSSGHKLASRHIRHADNALVTEALLHRLKEVGGADLIVRRHRFKYQGLTLENVEAEFPGNETDSLVLVTAHLDSTAAADGSFDPAIDPAPGADDDASGVAAVLAITQAAARLRVIKKPKRSLRFVLFNAEEQGLVGSKSYARGQAAQGADIAAVFQMDMIGFRRQQQVPSGEFEIHAGFPASADVESRSLALAEIIQSVIAQVSPELNAPQIYPDAVTGNPDPAAGRSDHSSFHERGYAACVLTEDFFAGPKPDSPAPQGNVNYHREADREIDYKYAAAITRAVAAAALVAANA